MFDNDVDDASSLSRSSTLPLLLSESVHGDIGPSRGLLSDAPLGDAVGGGDCAVGWVMPGVVMAPSGYWHRSNRKGATVHALTPPAFADLGRAPTFSDVLVQVGRI